MINGIFAQQKHFEQLDESAATCVRRAIGLYTFVSIHPRVRTFCKEGQRVPTFSSFSSVAYVSLVLPVLIRIRQLDCCRYLSATRYVFLSLLRFLFITHVRLICRRSIV